MNSNWDDIDSEYSKQLDEFLNRFHKGAPKHIEKKESDDGFTKIKKKKRDRRNKNSKHNY